MCVGIKIKSYLKEHGIKQTYISSITGIPTSKLNMALNGNRKMTFEEYELICGVLKVDTNLFLKPKQKERMD